MKLWRSWWSWLTISACLVALAALHACALRQNVYSGYPYEQWDEIGSSNNAAVLDEPETLRVYSYGSLDTFVHMLAHFYYQKFDAIGKHTLRHSYANNVLQSLSDPFLMFGPKSWEGLDHNYFRGLADRMPIFLARKIYFVIFSFLTLALLLTGVTLYRFPVSALLPVVLCLSAAPFVEQSAYAYPNASNAMLGGLICVLTERAVTLRSFPFLIAASVLCACAVNFKLDALMFGFPIAMGLIGLLGFCLLEREPVWFRMQKVLRGAAACALSFGAALVITKPSLLWRPRAEIAMQWNTLNPMVGIQTEPAKNFEAFKVYLKGLFPGLENLQLTECLSWQCALLLLLCLWSCLRRREADSKARPGLIGLGIVAVSSIVFLLVPLRGSAVIYPRYFLNGTLACALSAALVLAYLASSRFRIVRGFSACICIALVPLAFASFSYTYSAARNADEQRAKLRGLDPAHNRNTAIFRLAEEIQAGRLARTVLVDQHAYFDLRYLLARGIKVRYLNIFNFEKVLPRYARRHNSPPIAMIYVEGDGGWGGEPGQRFQRYFQTLKALPQVIEVQGHIMSTLSPAPPHPHVNAHVAVASAVKP